MTSWKRFRKCPVCNAEKNVRCQYTDSLDFFQCKGGIHYKGAEIELFQPAEILSGKWFCIGESPRERLINYKHESVYQLPKSGNSDKLNREFRPFPDTSVLLDAHRKHLSKRGLSEEQINRGRFRSLTESYLTTYRCSDKSGFDIPCWVASRPGKVNYQTKWLSSDTPYTWGVPGAKYEGEMPLTYVDFLFNERATHDTVWACEGMLKPYITHSLMLDLFPVLGASGGMFAASSKILQTLVRQFGIKEVVYCPDAGWRHFGDKSENGVFRTVDASIRCFKRLGLSVKIADWGQWDDKQSCDIDELLTEYGGIDVIEKIKLYSI